MSLMALNRCFTSCNRISWYTHLLSISREKGAFKPFGVKLRWMDRNYTKQRDLIIDGFKLAYSRNKRAMWQDDDTNK
jgi:hypothetical protein